MKPTYPSSIKLGDERLPVRFWSKVQPNDAGCWAWTATLHPRNGYGQFLLGRKRWMAHRLAYHALVEPLDGLDSRFDQIDHLCRNRACVKPSHLELVSNRVNMARGIGTGQEGVRAKLLTGRCPRGHRYWVTVPSRPPTTYRCRGCQDMVKLTCAAQHGYWE